MFEPFHTRLARLTAQHAALITRPNEPDLSRDNGLHIRYRHPVLTAARAPLALRMAEATLAEGIAADGGVVNEADATGVIDARKGWWPQAEAMVGFFNAYELSGDRRFLDQSLASWRFVQEHIVDHKDGEWLWGVDEQGAPRDEQMSGPWKGPHHNGCACMEIMRRIEVANGAAETRR